MAHLLNVVYLLLLAAASPWLVWRAARTGRYREGFAEKFLGRVPRRVGGRRCVWFHAVSVGEVSLLRPLVNEFRRRHPDWDCVLSTTSRAGREVAARLYPELTICYCPLDFTWSVRAAMDRLRPDLLVLAELELWPNLIAAAAERAARVAVVNGRISERSFRGYKRIRPLAGRLLARLDLVAAQSEQYARRFRALGARSEAVRVTGSLKFDGAQSDRDNPATRSARALVGWPDDAIVFLAGSTQSPEERLALEAFRALAPREPRLRLILVPRHPERFDEVAALLDSSGLAYRRLSELQTSSPAFPPPPSDWRILLLDRMGELAAYWGLAQIAYVGGSMGPREGQNMIEPAAYGAAVSFGPRTRNFREVVALLLARDAAVVVQGGDELTAFVRGCLDHPAVARGLGERARSVVLDNLGATGRTAELLDALLAPADGHARQAA